MKTRGKLGLALRAALAGGVCALALAGAAAAQTRDFDVPAGDLKAALDSYARQAGVEVIYRVEDVRGAKTKGVHGALSAREALADILQGTGFAVRQDQSGALAVVRGNGDESGPGPTKVGEVVVTGTHIRGVPPSSPVIEIQRTDIDRSGATDVGDLLRTLPQNFGGGNSPLLTTVVAPGQPGEISGGSAPNLRGLGGGSTLTLLDGHRLPEDFAGAVDITPIPLGALQRVDVLTDGASATYGSDAVAGVVNFILRKDFDGLETSAEVGGATQGGAFEQRFEGLFGKTWESGNALIDYEYQNQTEVSASQRTYTQSAENPYTLIPAFNRSSVFAAVNQNITPDISLFVEGLYSTRQTNNSVTAYGFTSIDRFALSNYWVTVGANANLPDNWKASLAGSFAQQDNKTGDDQYIASPYSTFSQEHLVGQTASGEIEADGPLFTLPTGDVLLALGAGVRRETFSYLILDPGDTIAEADGARHIEYAFGEMQIPLVAPSDRLGLNRLDLNISGRIEHYSDFGSNAVPKVGLVYVAAPELTFKGSWGKSFRAPTLDNITGPQEIAEEIMTDPLAPGGSSAVLERLGGNPDLRPETAQTFNLSVNYAPEWLGGWKFTGSYFNIDYTNRIGSIPDPFGALSNPADATFVTRNPSAALQQQLLAEATGGFFDETTMSYNPADIAAIVDGRPLNISKQTIDGVDFQVVYAQHFDPGQLDLALNGTYLNLSQQLTPTSPSQELAGTTYNPPRFRMRAQGTWTQGAWATTATVNYQAAEKDHYAAGDPSVSPWTTLDFQISYAAPSGPLAGLRAALSVINLFDAKPPFVPSYFYPGLNYDPTNATPLGRFVSLRLIKKW